MRAHPGPNPSTNPNRPGVLPASCRQNQLQLPGKSQTFRQDAGSTFPKISLTPTQLPRPTSNSARMAKSFRRRVELREAQTSQRNQGVVELRPPKTAPPRRASFLVPTHHSSGCIMETVWSCWMRFLRGTATKAASTAFLPTRLRGRSRFGAAKARPISFLPGRSSQAKAGPMAASPVTPGAWCAWTLEPLGKR